LHDGVGDGTHLNVGQANMHNHGWGNGRFSGKIQGTITDSKTYPSAFLRIADRTTDAKSAYITDPLPTDLARY
jgi:hypothetical protein